MPTETEKLLEESAAIDLEMKRVQLELQKEQLAEINQKKEARRLKLEQQQRDMKENARQEQARFDNCKHKKGGRNRSGLDRGTDSNYAIVRQTMPTGELVIMCQRCGCTWEKPTVALKRSDPDAYADQLRKFRIACEWPTDNEDMGMQIFLVQRAPRPRPTDDEADTEQIRRPRGKKRSAA
jgi:hypothetical protein